MINNKINTFNALPEEKVENKIAIRKLETDLANATIKDMDSLVEERKKTFVNELVEVQNKIQETKKDTTKGDGYNSMVISELLFKPISHFYGSRPLYTAEKLSIAFELYRDMVVQCNINGLKIVPNKSHFSRFCGFSTPTYDRYLDSTDISMRNLMEVIDDYMFDINITSAQHREIELATTMYRAKVEQGKMEPIAPQTHILSPDADMEKIIDDIKRIKEGKRVVVGNDFVEGHFTEYNGKSKSNKGRIATKNK